MARGDTDESAGKRKGRIYNKYNIKRRTLILLPLTISLPQHPTWYQKRLLAFLHLFGLECLQALQPLRQGRV